MTLLTEKQQQLLARQHDFYAVLDSQKNETLRLINDHTANGTLHFEENGACFTRLCKERTLDEAYGTSHSPAPRIL